WSCFLVLGNSVTQSLVLSEWSTDEASSVAVRIVSVGWRWSEAWSLVKLLRSRMHRFGVEVLVRVLNSYPLVTGTWFY
ncbi:unnamed protein product, partial [Brassica rapa]